MLGAADRRGRAPDRAAGVFEAIVPFLIAGSSVLLLLQPVIARKAGERLVARRERGQWFGALASCVYAGYFGAAAAVLFMALVGLFSTDSIHELNAMKNVLIGVANAVAAVTFAFAAPVDWTAAARARGRQPRGRRGRRRGWSGGSRRSRCGSASPSWAWFVAVWLLID